MPPSSSQRSRASVRRWNRLGMSSCCKSQRSLGWRRFSALPHRSDRYSLARSGTKNRSSKQATKIGRVNWIERGKKMFSIGRNLAGYLPLATRALLWLAGVTALAFAVGLVQAFNAPDDFQQGATVLLMFLHVPAAWLITPIWGVMSIAAIVTLVWRHQLADIAAKTAAPIGLRSRFCASSPARSGNGRCWEPIGGGMVDKQPLWCC